MKTLPILIALSLTITANAALDAFKLVRKPKLNESYTYKQTLTLEDTEGKMDIIGEITEKITKLNENGSYLAEVTDKTEKIKVEGEELEIGEESVHTATTLATGELELVEADDDPSEDGTYRFSNLTSLIYPKEEVNVGATWTHAFKEDSKKGTKDAEVTYKVESEEKLMGFDAVKVSLVGKEKAGSKPFSTAGTVWVRKSDGLMLKFEVEMKNLPIDDEEVIDAAKVVMELKV